MASMTYLQLAQFAGRYLRSSNLQGGAYPTAIPVPANQDQMSYDIVDAIPRAWEWVQNEHPSWNFMRKQGILPLVSGTRVYTLTAIQAQISDYYGYIPFWALAVEPYFLLYDAGASAPQDYIYPFVEYQNWRGWWDRVPRPSANQPNRLTERPDKSLEVDPTPTLAPSGGAWTLRLDYRIKNQVLSASGDVPILPPEFHEMIAWVAIRMLTETRMNSGPLLAAAQNEIQKYMDRLKSQYLPQLQIDLVYA
jgi:hypothetical protein